MGPSYAGHTIPSSRRHPLANGTARFVNSNFRTRLGAFLAAAAAAEAFVGVALIIAEARVPGVLVLALALLVSLPQAGWALASPSRRRSVEFGPDGIEVTLGSGRVATLPWRDVGGWGFGLAVAGAVTAGSSAGRGLLIWPAGHVNEPSEETRPLWGSHSRCWTVLELREMRASEDEIRAAMRTYAPVAEGVPGGSDSSAVETHPPAASDGDATGSG